MEDNSTTNSTPDKADNVQPDESNIHPDGTVETVPMPDVQTETSKDTSQDLPDSIKLDPSTASKPDSTAPQTDENTDGVEGDAPNTQQTKESVEDMNAYIFSRVKGEKNFKAVAEYLQSNLPKEEIDVINELLLSGSKLKVDLALDQAVQKYNALRGKGKLMSGDTPAAPAPFVPMSRDEYYRVMRTDKYKQDKAYQKQVDTQRAKSLAMDKAKFQPGVYFERTSDGIRRL